MTRTPPNKVFFDIETTGFAHKDTDRIIEVFAMEFDSTGKPTGREFYALVDPERSIPAEATAVHGKSDADVAGKPKFKEVAHELMTFMEGAEVIAHNGRTFDEPFINSELIRAGIPYTFWEKPAKCTDTMQLSRQIWPRQKATLDAVCGRLEIDLTEREQKGHSAKLDVQILAAAYFKMVELHGIDNLAAADHEQDVERAPVVRLDRGFDIPAITVAPAEIQRHEQILDQMQEGGVAPVARAARAPRM